MVQSTGMKVIKVLMIIFNILFLLGGLALIIIGAIVQAEASKINTVNAAGVLVIVLGCVIFILSFFGCCGAWKENRCMLLTFGVLMIIIFVICLAAIIVAFVYRSKAESVYVPFLRATLKEYDPSRPQLSTFWHYLQYDGECCGIYNFTDWAENSHLVPPGAFFPAACCKVNNETATCRRDQLVYKEGCLSKLVTNAQKAILVVGAVVAAVAILEIIGIIFAFVLANAIHKGYNVV